MKRIIRIEYTENENFEVVVAYVCKYCREVFLSTRHRCRYNPSYKGCFTCKNKEGLKDVVVVEEPISFLDLDEDDLIAPKKIICRKGINPSLDCVRSNGWNYQCTSWENDQ